MFERLYRWYGRKTVWGIGALVVILLVVAFIIRFSSDNTDETTSVVPVVVTASISELSGQQSISLLGTVRAVSEADIQTETAGRVTSVSVALGDSVSAGQTIATLENAQERAAVLQAEGAYEAAVAASSLSNISVDSAEDNLTSVQNTAIQAAQSAYTTVSNAFYTELDELYKNPDSGIPQPYVVGDDSGYLRNERIAFRTVLPDWQNQVSSLTVNSDIDAALATSLSYTNRTRSLIDAFIVALQDRTSETLNGVAVTTWITTLNTERAALNAQSNALTAARSSIKGAEDAVEKAKIGGTNSEISTANAQVKQALGVLRSAQANLAKTILTSPISGTVNELNINLGDFVSSFTPVAKVANNNALQVTVFVGESDLNKLTVGDSVIIDNEFEGSVTHIGAGVDRDTQKTEVKIATETNKLTNGDTVTVTLIDASTENTDQTTVLPISAIKFTADDGYVYTVRDGVLFENPIEIGTIRGGFVEVVRGITSDMEIVVDARGLTAGSKVEASK